MTVTDTDTDTDAVVGSPGTSTPRRRIACRVRWCYRIHPASWWRCCAQRWSVSVRLCGRRRPRMRCWPPIVGWRRRGVRRWGWMRSCSPRSTTGVPTREGLTHPIGWLAKGLRLGRGEACKRCRRAAKIASLTSMTGQTLPPTLPATTAAVAEGAIQRRMSMRSPRSSPTSPCVAR